MPTTQRVRPSSNASVTSETYVREDQSAPSPTISSTPGVPVFSQRHFARRPCLSMRALKWVDQGRPKSGVGKHYAAGDEHRVQATGLPV